MANNKNKRLSNMALVFTTVAIIAIAVLLSGCAFTHTDVGKGTFTTLTVLKEVSIDSVDIRTDPNGCNSIVVKGSSVTSSSAGDIVLGIVGFFTGWLSK